MSDERGPTTDERGSTSGASDRPGDRGGEVVETDVTLPGESEAETVPSGFLVFDPIRATIGVGAIVGGTVGAAAGFAFGPPVAAALLAGVFLVGGGGLAGVIAARHWGN